MDRIGLLCFSPCIKLMIPHTTILTSAFSEIELVFGAGDGSCNSTMPELMPTDTDLMSNDTCT